MKRSVLIAATAALVLSGCGNEVPPLSPPRAAQAHEAVPPPSPAADAAKDDSAPAPAAGAAVLPGYLSGSGQGETKN